ncbi:MAG TPA: hypothetical protein VHV78_14810, partial [Gemmatimonadaceae bacterium]|nr:hypothetical protein [Gemmatimonadaceae bacterium]
MTPGDWVYVPPLTVRIPPVNVKAPVDASNDCAVTEPPFIDVPPLETLITLPTRSVPLVIVVTTAFPAIVAVLLSNEPMFALEANMVLPAPLTPVSRDKVTVPVLAEKSSDPMA